MIKLRLNQELKTPQGKKVKGSIIELEADKNNIPFDYFWRRRIEDSAIDNCVSIIQDSKTKK